MNNLLKNISYRKYVQALCLFVIDLIFFTSTNTTSDPSYLIIIGFFLVSLSFYCLTYIVLSLIKFYGLPINRKRRLSWYITALFSSLIALQSIGQLSPKDVAVLMPLAVIGYLYTGYAKSAREKIN
jgi:hypothetical protein